MAASSASEMSRDDTAMIVTTTKNESIALPSVYGYPENEDGPLQFCWQCKCFFLCCGGCCEQSRLPFGFRVIDFLVSNIYWASGMYQGGKFNRKLQQDWMDQGAIPTGEDTREHVVSWDATVQSSHDSNVKIPVRLFRSTDQSKTKNEKIMVYMHGGGWCISHPELPHYHRLGTQIAKAGYIVVSVDYRLAPEHPFPAALFDSFDVCQWVASRPSTEPCFADMDVSKLELGGDSAGGNLAMVISSLVRDGLGPDLKPCDIRFSVKQQLLIYPWFVMRRFVKEPAPSNLPLLGKNSLDFFFDSYVPGKTLVEKRAFIETERRICPIVGGFHNLPRTIMFSAGKDFLHFENEISVECMKQAG